MSPELETLDQLLSDDLPITMIRQLFPDQPRFEHSIGMMLASGEIELIDSAGNVLSNWLWSKICSEKEQAICMRLTPFGAGKIG
jgi:hypothetical protein